jgi:hypothetical protein
LINILISMAVLLTVNLLERKNNAKAAR